MVGSVYPLSFKGSATTDEYIGRVGRIIDIQIISEGNINIGARLKVVLGVWQYLPFLSAFGFGVRWLPFGEEDNYFPEEVFRPSLEKLYFEIQKDEGCSVLIEGDMGGVATFTKVTEMLMREIKRLGIYNHLLYAQLKNADAQSIAVVKDVWKTKYEEPMKMVREQIEAFERIHPSRRENVYPYGGYQVQPKHEQERAPPMPVREPPPPRREEVRPSLIKRIPFIGHFLR